MNRYLFLTALVFIITGPVISFAEAPYQVTLTGDPWPPFVFGEHGEEATEGTGVELMELIFSHIPEAEVSFPLVPWNRALQDVKQDYADGIFILIKTPERERYMEYTDPLFFSRELLWYTEKTFPEGFEWQDFADLTPYSIGIVSGYSYGTEVTIGLETGALKTATIASAKLMFSMLSRGRIDLAFANETAGSVLADQYTRLDNRILATEKPLSATAYYVAFSKNSPARRFIPAINKAIATLKDEDVIKKIIGTQ